MPEPLSDPGPRPFVLRRLVDETGVSGTGVVAEGVEFSDGTVALRWLSQWPTSVVFHDRGMAREAAREALAVLGPQACADTACEGCRWEIDEALATLRAALEADSPEAPHAS
jgi:hypothetical protein